MGKLKIGDKVRILDVDAIIFGSVFFNNGDITEVVGFFADDPDMPELRATKEVAGEDSLFVDKSEFHAIEKVGERGEELPQHEALLERVIALEAKVDDMKARVEFLRLRQRKTSERLTTVVKLDGKVVGEAIAKAVVVRPSANELRKEAIKKARKFVEDVTEAAGFGRKVRLAYRGNDTLSGRGTAPEFIVNEEKRTVVALARGLNSGKVHEKGIAKCAPSDVFNADIGKAIALGRAYGLDVSEFEQAPQPDEVVPGMKTTTLFSCTGEVVDGYENQTVVRVTSEGYPVDEDGLHSSHYRITSDTEAEYEKENV